MVRRDPDTDNDDVVRGTRQLVEIPDGREQRAPGGADGEPAGFAPFFDAQVVMRESA